MYSAARLCFSRECYSLGTIAVTAKRINLHHSKSVGPVHVRKSRRQNEATVSTLWSPTFYRFMYHVGYSSDGMEQVNHANQCRKAGTEPLATVGTLSRQTSNRAPSKKSPTFLSPLAFVTPATPSSPWTLAGRTAHETRPAASKQT